MTGKENGFIGLCRKDPLFPKFIAYDCLIHQEMLFAKTTNLNHIMPIVTKSINSIKTKATQHRLFKLFLENENTEFKDLLLHTGVRWLTRGKVLERFINLLPQVKECVASINEVYDELENKNWLLDLGFKVDMIKKLAVSASEIFQEICLEENPVEHFTCERLIRKLEKGRNLTSVAEKFGINNSVVSRFWKDFQTISTAVKILLVATPVKPAVHG
ncbi:general transcription factor II-I repeat domain-containing protein 2 [Trichonephila clavipes]|nr:general transcription factor II-I repeat domain-containing protein 2 [Trichonephila clavipes]